MSSLRKHESYVFATGLLGFLMISSSGSAQDEEPAAGTPTSRTELPPIAVSTDTATVEAIRNASEMRDYFRRLQSDARSQSNANLSQIDQEARTEEEALAKASAAAWNKAQTDYADRLKELADLDIDSKERQRRQKELAKTKDDALLALSADREAQFLSIRATRESRRATELTRFTELDRDLSIQLESRVTAVQGAAAGRAQTATAPGSPASSASVDSGQATPGPTVPSGNMASPGRVTPPGNTGVDLAGTLPQSESLGDEVLRHEISRDEMQRREQMFAELQERRRRAEEAAERRANRPRGAGSGSNDQYRGLWDCDDNDRSINPDSKESCNYKDDDCDGSVDQDPVTGAPLYAFKYLDRDGDLHGDPNYRVGVCEQTTRDEATGAILVDHDNDCDDTDDSVWRESDCDAQQ